MKNYNLFSVLGVILVLAFVFTGSAMADPDGEEKKKKEKNDSERDIDNAPFLEDFSIISIEEDIENLSIEGIKRLRIKGNNAKPAFGKAPVNPTALSRVQVSQLRPSRSSAGTVVFTWITKSETENAGFNILRSKTRNGPFKPINSALIQGAGTTKKKQMYRWTDASAKPNVVYYYQLEMISFAGARQRLTAVRLQGHVSASGKLAAKWAMLRARR